MQKLRYPNNFVREKNKLVSAVLEGPAGAARGQYTSGTKVWSLMGGRT